MFTCLTRIIFKPIGGDGPQWRYSRSITSVGTPFSFNWRAISKWAFSIPFSKPFFIPSASTFVFATAFAIAFSFASSTSCKKASSARRFSTSPQLPFQSLPLLYDTIPICVKQLLHVLDLALEVYPFIRIFHHLAMGA